MLPAIFNKSFLTRLHFYLLVLILINWMISINFDTGLHWNITFTTKIIFWLLGIILFFLFIKTKGWPKNYFALYWVLPVLTLLVYALDQLMGAIIAIALLLFFYYPAPEFKSNDYTFYQMNTGPMSPCCGVYEIRQTRFFIFQKKVGKVAFYEDCNFKNFTVKEGKGYLQVQKQVYEKSNVHYTDTMFIIPLK